LHKRVTSAATKRRQTQCWDLAMGALEAARDAGFNVPQQPSSYVWSKKALSAQDAQAGDIAQFVSWYQSGKKVTHAGGGWSMSGSLSTGPRHTAVVVGDFDGECFTTYDQNPSPVHESKYCPNRKTGGSVIIYRLSASRLRLDNEDPATSAAIAETTGFKPQGQSIPQALLWSASIAAVALFAVAGRSIYKWGFKRGQASTYARVADRVLINVEATDGSMEPLTREENPVE